MHPSVHKLWRAYLRSIGETPGSTDKAFAAWSFGDTPALADALIALVLRGAKRATSPSVWELEAHGEPRPQLGDLRSCLGDCLRPTPLWISLKKPTALAR